MMTQAIKPTFDAWRDAARALLLRNISPDEVIWRDERSSAALPFVNTTITSQPGRTLPIPSVFMQDAAIVACHREPTRWDLLYRLAYRLTHGEPNLLAISVDEEVARFRNMAKAVRRDNHKMHAFVRFKSVADEEGERFVAFHRPDHYIVRLTTPFFVERFRVMRFSILTPDESVEWDGREVRFGPGVSFRCAATADDIESLWLTYYRSIFNPARLKVKHMIQELPKRHWRTLPEAALIPELIQSADKRSETMQEMAAERAKYEVAPVPASRSLNVLHAANQTCLACPWTAKCTQPVFGAGRADAKIVLIGEQPGDMEDKEGKPFVGPAGQLLRRVIDDIGIDPGAIYFTNAVKHFKFEERGLRRIHQTPSARDVSVCKPWLVAELEAIQPTVIVCLGATAAKSVLGNGFRITQSRGELMPSDWCKQTIATYHPSAILRVPEKTSAEQMRAMLASDLKKAASLL